MSEANVKNTSTGGATLIRTSADVDPLTCPEQYEDVDQNLNGNESGYSTSAALTLNVQDLGKQVQVQNGKKTNNNNNKKTNGEGFKTTGASKQQTVFYTDAENCRNLEEVLEDFVASLFWILESKRLDRSQERLDRLQLLMTPFEKKECVGVDTETKNYKKRCQGRLRKHLGDLCLLAGMPAEALLHYQTALDILKSANDYLWVAAAYEGICSASVIMSKNSLVDQSPLHRNRSFSLKRGTNATHDALNKDGGSMFANGLDLADTRDKHCLLPDDIIEKYKDALQNYSKFKMAGIVEMEASLKACRVLIMQQKYLEASYILQNVVYINLQLSEDEKIERYGTLSQLYLQIGFHRKASFFKRVAAVQCIAQPNAPQGWQRCYNLLLQSLEGYRLPLDPRDLPKDHASGWAVVQMRVLHELIFSSRKMGNPALAVRHLTFLVHAMLEYLEPQERREMCVALESYTAKSEGTTTSITLENGSILAPVALTKIPLVKSFKLSNLTPHMQPIRAQVPTPKGTSGKGGSPFIYSPFLEATGSDHDKPAGPRMGFHWVEGEVCEVALQVYNPLPFDLKVTNMGLTSSGVELEVYPTNFTLPPESGPHPVKIMMVPKETGVLSISGYTSHVLGIRSNCLLHDLSCVDVDVFEVEVIPGLPQLNLSTSLPQNASFGSLTQSPIVVTSASTTLYAGQSCECLVTLTNKGKIPIERLDVSLESKYRTDLISEMFSWSCDSVQTQLPLQPQNQACFTVCVHGLSSFLNEDSQTQGSKYSLVSEITGNLNVEALLKLEYSGGPGHTDNYFRQCAVSLSAEVIPSVVFSKWDILPTHSDEKCHLVFDLENVTAHEMGISHNTAFNIVLEADCCRRFCVPVVKCNAPISPVPNTHSLQSLVKEHLSGLLDIQWRMASSGGEGRVKMDHLTFKEDQLQVMLHSPFRWAVELNDQGYQPNSGVTFQDGCPVSVLVKLHNQSGQRLENGTLSVRCQTEDRGSHHQDAFNEAVLYSGARFTTLNTVDPDECISHKLEIVFLQPGHYVLNCECRGTLATMGDLESSDISSSISYTDSIDSHTQTWHCQPQICIQVYDSDQHT